MDTHPELDETRSSLGWRPFGDALPLPTRRRTPPPRASEHATPVPGPRAAPPVPLWLPFAVALAIGAAIALVAALARPAAQTAGPETRATPAWVPIAATRPPPATSAPTPALAPTRGAPTRCASSPPNGPPRRPWRARAALHRRPALVAPVRVSDLKANPFATPHRIAHTTPKRWRGLRKVGDLKTNPFTR